MNTMHMTKKRGSHKISIWLELILLLMLAGGVYFIKSDLDLLALLQDLSLRMDDQLIQLKLSSITLYNTALEELELSDIVGIIVIGWALVIAFMRFRHRLVTAFTLADDCPECGTALIRNNRTIIQRLVAKGLMLNSMSFYCTECKEKNLIFRYKIKATT